MLLQETESNNPFTKFTEWGNAFVHSLPLLLTAIIFLVVIFFLSGFVRRLAGSILKRRKGNPAIATVMASFISTVFIIIGVFIALGILGLNQTVTSILAGAGILGLILGLALQDTLSSAVAGIIMANRKSYKVGDFVESNGYLGTIVELNLRNTTIRQTTGSDVKIPNKLVLNNPLTNYTLTGERRVDITVGVSYNEDLSRIEAIIRNTFKEVNYNKDRELEIFFTDLAAGSVKILIRYWIRKFKQYDHLAAQSEGVMAIKKAFDENKIAVPYPIHLVDLKDSPRI
ncbi:MAG: mechanosensitive ion channel family protein [Chitinophagales bacterium]